ncbi:MAG TPA: maleylpyruvate isomerase family mycothiol-dependent enzyme [Mycobacteriales bacterium]|nr:maleylpyruvate isomerase family mycothiol-dependent enzyme [Mycobacteriales bacterium]
MLRERYLELLNQDGALLRTAAERDLDAPVPSCPGWTARDVVTHTAEVYEHKLACVALAGEKPDPWPPEWPADRDPLEWFDDAHTRVVAMLRETDPAAPSWTWWPADQTAGFWVRRMAQETAMHRVDTELASGASTPIDAELAVDGIDEVLMLMFAGDWTGDEEPELTGTVAVAAPARRWTIRMSPDLVDVEEAEQEVEATVAGEPSPLLLWLYGRAPIDVVSVYGSADVVDRLRARLAIATR